MLFMGTEINIFYGYWTRNGIFYLCFLVQNLRSLLWEFLHPKICCKSITGRALFKDQCPFPVLLKSLESMKKVIIYWYTSQMFTNTSIKFRLFLRVRLHISCTWIALCSYTFLKYLVRISV